MRSWSLTVLLLGTLMAGGCQQTLEPDHIPITADLITKTRNAPITTIELNGRIGVHWRKNYSASFSYVKTPEMLKFELISAIGNSIAKIQSQGGDVILQAGGHEFRTNSMPALIGNLLGLDLPFEILNDILLARVETVLDADANGLVHSGRSKGLQVNYDGYRVYNSLLLPTDIRITAGPSQVRIRVHEVLALR